MVSKNQKKLIKSLNQKKYRKQHGLFVAEGKKVIHELLDAKFKIYSIFTIDESLFDLPERLVHVITVDELKQLSFLSTPQLALAIFYIPESKPVDKEALIVALDDVRDPGNLGTIIRLCDWFDIRDLVCSAATVDCFNPKVIQATMGSITRVNISYVHLEEFLHSGFSKESIFGTFMDGDSVYQKKLPKKGVVIMGNEANGISKVIESSIQERIAIPQFGSDKSTESLNVATAAAIILSEFRRS